MSNLILLPASTKGGPNRKSNREIMMEKNELKKNFYKYGNIAEFKYALKGKLYYAVVFAEQTVMFEIPMEDIGDSKFDRDIPAKLLIRYML